MMVAMIVMSVAMVFLALVGSVSGCAPITVSAAVNDNILVSGLDELNLNIVAPFDFKDYAGGAKFSLRGTTLSTDSVFIKHSFGKVLVDTSYTISKKLLSVATAWKSENLGLTLEAKGNSADELTTVAVSKATTFKGNKLSVNTVYDVLKKKVMTFSSFASDDSNVTYNLKYDSSTKIPVLSATCILDDSSSLLQWLWSKMGNGP